MSLAAVIIGCYLYQYPRSVMAERFGAPDRGTALGGTHSFKEQESSKERSLPLKRKK